MARTKKDMSGENNGRYAHGKINHPLYNSWKAAKRKCYNKNAADYLGDGFEVCEEWKNNFNTFYEWGINNGWESGRVLTRIDETKGFYPSNCCFKTKKEVIKNNINIEKAKNTCLEKYGANHYTKTDEYKQRVKQLSLDKYGCEHHSQSEFVKEKIRTTNKKRYGSECALSSEIVKDKIRQTNIDRYGGPSPTCDESIKKKQIDTRIEKYGHPFPKTTNNTEEKNVKKWINELGFSFESNFDILNGKEIDMLDISVNIGIEYCGLYWHSDIFDGGRNRHYDKMIKAALKGIRLITIFSDEWLYRKQQVQNFLRSILNKNATTIFARKCEVIEIPAQQCMDFVTQYHIQPHGRKPLISYGLLYGGEIIGVMSLNHHHRQKGLCVLDRLCWKDNLNVPGGSSRLLKYCKGWAKQQGFDKIISWSDNRWSQGKVYESLGFALEKELGPDYSYIKISNPKIRIAKQKMTKKKINCPPDKTEIEWTRELGFARIWDCGKKRWVINL